MTIFHSLKNRIRRFLQRFFTPPKRMAGPVLEAVLELPRIVGLGFWEPELGNTGLDPELGLVTNLGPCRPTRSGSGLGGRTGQKPDLDNTTAMYTICIYLLAIVCNTVYIRIGFKMWNEILVSHLGFGENHTHSWQEAALAELLLLQMH
jgi:hypothetical protein